MQTKCKECQGIVKGRSDKKFCSIECKNKYNITQKKMSKSLTQPIFNILLRNREILETLIGSGSKFMIDKYVLDQTGFKYDYHTSHYINKEGKTYWIVFDFAWMAFSTQKIMIIRKSK